MKEDYENKILTIPLMLYFKDFFLIVVSSIPTFTPIFFKYHASFEKKKTLKKLIK